MQAATDDMIATVPAPLDAVAIARLDALVTHHVLVRRPGPDLSEALRYLERASADFVDATNERINPRSRFRIACNAAFASVDALLAAYGLVPQSDRRFYPDVLAIFFRQHPCGSSRR